MFDKEKITTYKCIIAPDGENDWRILSSTPDLFAPEMGEFVESTSLTDWLNEQEHNQLPKENGIYYCEMTITSYQSNRFDDTVEWDYDVTINNFETILLYPI